MRIHHEVMIRSLVGLWVAAAASLQGCAPKAVPLEVVLDSPQHHVQSGMKFLGLGKYGDAFREFELAKESDPVFSKAYVGSGLVRGHRGDYERGVQEIQRAREMARTDDEEVFANVGLIRFYVIEKGSVCKKWLQEAESAYKQAVAVLPESSEAHYYMAEVYRVALQLKKARELFNKVLEINNTYIHEARRGLRLIDNIKKDKT